MGIYIYRHIYLRHMCVCIYIIICIYVYLLTHSVKTICHFQGRTSLLMVHLILTELKNCECMATIQLPFMLNPTMVLFPTGRSSSNLLEHGVSRFSAVTNNILSGSTQQPQEYRLKSKPHLISRSAACVG